MKIGEFLKIQSVDGSAETQKSGGANKDDDFAALLRNELSGAGETTSSERTSELCPTISTAGIAGIAGLDGDEKLGSLLEGIEGLISKLQSFEQTLKSDASPKQVDEIVNQLGDLAEKLQANMGGASAYQGLDDLTQEVNVTAYMESVKWRRGDYL